MKGIALKITLVLLLITVGICRAEKKFVYQVSDTVKTANLHYSIFVNLGIGKTIEGKPAIRYEYYAHMKGVNLPSYQYIAMEERTLALSEGEFQDILEQLSELSTDNLRDGASLTRELSDGYIEIRGKRHAVSSRPDTAARQLWTRAIVAVRDKYVPKEKRKSYIRTIEGDKVPAKPVTFDQLYQNKEKYDGKRVKVSGYRVKNMLYLNKEVYEKKAEKIAYEKSRNIRIITGDNEGGIPLGGPSDFAEARKVGFFNGKPVNVEGTFEYRPSPPFADLIHKGTIGRLTLLEEIKKP